MSLNGVSTIEEINEMIFLQLAGTTSQLAFQGMKLLGKYGGGLSTIIPLPESMLEKAFEKFGEGIASKIQSDKIEGLKDIILCFDDLERIDDKLSMKQIFGFINSNFIEHNNLKVIFISNEKEIKDESYEIIKEKVIGRTLKYVQSKNNVFEEIVNSVYKDNEYLMNFYEVEADNLKLSIDLLFENINLRALRFILDTFCILQEKGYELAQDDTEFIILSKSLFLNVLIISNEYKGGKFKKLTN